jgi:hypothetical protein
MNPQRLNKLRAWGKRDTQGKPTPSTTLVAIARVLSGHEWNANTNAQIADILRGAGFQIEEPDA